MWVQGPENVWRSALPLSLISLRRGLLLNLELAVLSSCVDQQVPRDPPITLPSPALQELQALPCFLCGSCGLHAGTASTAIHMATSQTRSMYFLYWS